MAAALLNSCSGNGNTDVSETVSAEITSSSAVSDTAAETVLTEAVTEAQTEAAADKSAELAEVLRSGNSLSARIKLLFTIPTQVSSEDPTVALKSAQGGTCDGKYWYQTCLRVNSDDESKNVVRIVKYDINTGKQVAISKDMSTCHSNDITYIPETNQLYVVHNAPNRKVFSVIDADTLEFIGTKQLNYDIYCMNYQPSKGLFVIGISGGQNFRFLKKDLSSTGKLNQATTVTTGYTTQGCASDDNFVYFVLHKQSAITVYDWSGKFVTVIHFDSLSKEPENISVIDGKIYVCCVSSGSYIYEIKPYLPTT